MKHVTVDEIIDFVTFDKIDSDTIANATRVNTHIRQCVACLKKVRAFQAVYDELEALGRQREFLETPQQDLFRAATDLDS